MSLPKGTEPIQRATLLGLLLIVTVGVTATQLFIHFVGQNTITVWSMLPLAATAACYAAFLIIYRKPLRLRAHARFLTHAAVYLLVNGSYWVHAGLILAFGDAVDLEKGWGGPLLGMSIIWGIGLLGDALGNLLSKGYDVRI